MRGRGAIHWLRQWPILDVRGDAPYIAKRVLMNSTHPSLGRREHAVATPSYATSRGCCFAPCNTNGKGVKSLAIPTCVAGELPAQAWRAMPITKRRLPATVDMDLICHNGSACHE